MHVLKSKIVLNLRPISATVKIDLQNLALVFGSILAVQFRFIHRKNQLAMYVCVCVY